MLRNRSSLVILFLAVACNQIPFEPTESVVDNQINLNPNQADSVQYHEVDIQSSDGTIISANVFLPGTEETQLFPAIVFINSWALEEHEYFIPGLSLAKKGYIVLSYSARGWGSSGGKVQVASPDDIEDVQAVLDWLQDNTSVDLDNIGIGGISYGAGISLIGLATDSRLKTAVSMSGWADLENSLYAGQTPALIWGSILLGSGYLTGDMDPVILEMFKKLLAHSDIDTVLDWAYPRSPVNYVDLINQKGAPVYLSNNYGDDLFLPNETLKMYQLLNVPKMIDINQGIHASAEISGLAGLPNHIWDSVFVWFDHHLKNGPVPMRKPVRMQIEHQGSWDSFADWPSSEIETTQFYLQPPGVFINGGLALEPAVHQETRMIFSGLDSGAGSGFVLVGSILDAHLNLPVLEWIPGLNRLHGVVYQSETQDSDLAIRGIPMLKVRVTPSHERLMMVAYLYDLDSSNVGRLITYGPLSQYDVQPNLEINLSIELGATAYDLKAGRRLVLVIDTCDVLYSPPTLLPYSLRFHHDQPMQAFLELPHRK